MMKNTIHALRARLHKVAPGMVRPGPKTVSVVRLSGTIATGGRRGSLSDEGLADVIERAFKRGKPAAVALVINSPGGSPVQSSLIAARIRRLSDETKVPVLAFVEDVAASGGYWLACSADEIIVDPLSIVGSIGVISAGFGLDGFIEKHGVSRRVYTAGKSKSILDPFRPENPADVKRLKSLLDDMHSGFIDYVKERRGDKLDAASDLFTGEFWLGKRAFDLGLVDTLGHMSPVLKARFGDKVRLQHYGIKRRIWSRIGANIIDQGVDVLDERAQFARYGL